METVIEGMIPQEKIMYVDAEVSKFKMWNGWNKKETLKKLGISYSTYCGWSYRKGVLKGSANDAAILQEEKNAVIEYALLRPTLRHRELAYKMIDEDVAYLSPSSVYRILVEANLVCRWKQQGKKREYPSKPAKPNERWQADIRYVQICGRKYYLLLFIDEYSRFISHHALLREMTGDIVSLEAQAAIEGLGNDKPVLQTDNGSCFISYDFAKVLNIFGVGHHRIHPHCPEENGLIERANRTIGSQIDLYEFDSYEEGKTAIKKIIDWYNKERLHSAIGYVAPIDKHTGRDASIQKKREEKLNTGRKQRIEKNKRIRISKEKARAFKRKNCESIGHDGADSLKISKEKAKAFKEVEEKTA